MILECPICEATITIKDPKEGKSVVCEECETKFELTQFDDEWDLIEVEENDWEEEEEEEF